MPPLLTFGHGPLGEEQLAALLTQVGVEAVVDIRRFPGSRGRPHLSAESMAEWLPRHGISYRSELRLGGRRTLEKGVESPDTWWTVAAFRAYAAHTRTQEFRDALDDLQAQAEQAVVAVMCSESVWWRCHRRLVADVWVAARGLVAEHVMPNAARRPHEPSAGARRLGDELVWDRPGSS